MASLYLELTIKYAIEVRLYGIDEEQKDELEDMGGIEEVDVGFIFDNNMIDNYETVVMNVDNFLDSETFSLEVKDEDGNVVYESNAPDSIVRYPYDEEENDEVVEAPNLDFKGVEPGTYIVENNNLKWCTISGEFEAEDFDPSKLSFYPSETFDDYICEDDVFLQEIRYDNQKLDVDVEYSDCYGSDFNLLESEDGHFKDFRR